MKSKTLDDFKVEGLMVLLRVDINAPVVDGRVQDSPRFEAAAETIKELLRKNAKVVVLAHQGRKGDKDFLSLEQHALMLGRYVGKGVRYIDDLFGRKARDRVMKLKEGEAILLENVRMYKDESNTKSRKNRYQTFCQLFDLYVNDAFSVCHREQGSIVIPPRYLPSAMGRGLEKELQALEHFDLEKFSGKGVFILGGAKVEDYLSLFHVLQHKSNVLVASGVLGNLLLVEQGYNLGYEKKWLEQEGYSRLLLQLRRFKKYDPQVILPADFVLKSRREVSLGQAPYQEKIMDMGKRSVERIVTELRDADVVFMKGPLGFSEYLEFSHGTVEVLKEIASLTREKKLFSLIGGGHLTTAIAKYKIPRSFSYMSLSGGALIAYLSGEKLPGLEALERGCY